MDLNQTSASEKIEMALLTLASDECGTHSIESETMMNSGESNEISAARATTHIDPRVHSKSLRRISENRDMMSTLAGQIRGEGRKFGAGQILRAHINNDLIGGTGKHWLTPERRQSVRTINRYYKKLVEADLIQPGSTKRGSKLRKVFQALLNERTRNVAAAVVRKTYVASSRGSKGTEPRLPDPIGTTHKQLQQFQCQAAVDATVRAFSKREQLQQSQCQAAVDATMRAFSKRERVAWDDVKPEWMDSRLRAGASSREAEEQKQTLLKKLVDDGVLVEIISTSMNAAAFIRKTLPISESKTKSEDAAASQKGIEYEINWSKKVTVEGEEHTWEDLVKNRSLMTPYLNACRNDGTKAEYGVSPRLIYYMQNRLQAGTAQQLHTLLTNPIGDTKNTSRTWNNGQSFIDQSSQSASLASPKHRDRNEDQMSTTRSRDGVHVAIVCDGTSKGGVQSQALAKATVNCMTRYFSQLNLKGFDPKNAAQMKKLRAEIMEHLKTNMLTDSKNGGTTLNVSWQFVDDKGQRYLMSFDIGDCATYIVTELTWLI